MVLSRSTERMSGTLTVRTESAFQALKGGAAREEIPVRELESLMD